MARALGGLIEIDNGIDKRCDALTDIELRKQFARINGHKLAFYFFGKGKRTILLLHGWGADSSALMFVARHLCVKYRVLLIDFPGFGDSEYPPEYYGVKEYADDALRLIERLGISSATIVGHSFGGRVAIELAAYHPELVEELVLVDSAGLKPRRGLKYYVRIAAHKLARSFGLKGLRGSSDYNTLPLAMRGVFVRVVNYYQNALLGQISCPCAVFWGADDRETPLYMYKYFLKHIAHSHGFMLEGEHFAYAQDGRKFLAILDALLE